MSMIREVTDGICNEGSILFTAAGIPRMSSRAELKSGLKDMGISRWSLVISDPIAGYWGETGFITAGLMKERVGGRCLQDFLSVRSPIMYSFCLKELETLGVPRKKMTEVFGPPKM